MRAVICEDKDARALLDKLKLEDVSQRAAESVRQALVIQHNVELDDKIFKDACHAMHRAFHYQVCSWLQDQGFSTI